MLIKSYTSLLNKINIKKYNIGIVGLGYVGLPLVKRFLKIGNIKIYGVDSDEKKVNLQLSQLILIILKIIKTK